MLASRKGVSQISVERNAAKPCLPNLLEALTPEPQAP